MKKVADTSKVEFRNHSAARLIGVLANILDGEITRMAGDVPGAIAKFETAVKLDDEMDYDEPEPLPFPARHWLGAALIEAKRFADAEKRLSRRSRAAPAQRVDAARIATGAQGAGQDRSGRRCRPREELVALGHLDQVVAFLGPKPAQGP